MLKWTIFGTALISTVLLQMEVSVSVGLGGLSPDVGTLPWRAYEYRASAGAYRAGIEISVCS